VRVKRGASELGPEGEEACVAQRAVEFSVGVLAERVKVLAERAAEEFWLCVRSSGAGVKPG
jgi:hypothetical protein